MPNYFYIILNLFSSHLHGKVRFGNDKSHLPLKTRNQKMDKCRFAVVGTILQTRLASRQLLFCSCNVNSKLAMHVKVQKQALTQIREIRTSAVLPLLPSFINSSCRNGVVCWSKVFEPSAWWLVRTPSVRLWTASADWFVYSVQNLNNRINLACLNHLVCEHEFVLIIPKKWSCA